LITTQTTSTITISREELAGMLSQYLMRGNFGTIGPDDIIEASYDLLSDESALKVTVRGEPWKAANAQPAPDSD